MGDHSDPTQPLMPHLHLRILNSASLIVLGKSEKVMQLCRYFCLCLNQLSILISIYICLPPKIPTHPRDFKGRAIQKLHYRLGINIPKYLGKFLAYLVVPRNWKSHNRHWHNVGPQDDQWGYSNSYRINVVRTFRSSINKKLIESFFVTTYFEVWFF